LATGTVSQHRDEVVEVESLKVGSRASGSQAYATVCEGISFSEDGSSSTYTGTVEIPAGAILHDIQFVTTVLWGAGTSAEFIIGDDDDPNGWLEDLSVKATDHLVGELISVMHADLWGGSEGAYLSAATGRRGRVTAGVDSGPYYGAASEVIGKVTFVGTAASTGRSFMFVTYSVPTVKAATGA
jgi:hypothetical protein